MSITKPFTRFLLVALLSGFSLLALVLLTSSYADAVTINEYAVPTASSYLAGITAGPDGNLWFTEEGPTANKIGKITTAGVVTEYTIPTAGSQPLTIVAGPDGNLWFTEYAAGKIGSRITGDYVVCNLNFSIICAYI